MEDRAWLRLETMLGCCRSGGSPRVADPVRDIGRGLALLPPPRVWDQAALESPSCEETTLRSWRVGGRSPPGIYAARSSRTRRWPTAFRGSRPSDLARNPADSRRCDCASP